MNTQIRNAYPRYEAELNIVMLAAGWTWYNDWLHKGWMKAGNPVRDGDAIVAALHWLLCHHDGVFGDNDWLDLLDRIADGKEVQLEPLLDAVGVVRRHQKSPMHGLGSLAHPS